MSDIQPNPSRSNVITGNFAHGFTSANSSPIERIIKLLGREVRQNKISYDQLKRIFREVRSRCDIKVPQKSQTLIQLPTTEQLKQFLKSVENPVHLLIIKTLLGTGLRVSELCNIEVSQIDFSKNQIFVHQGKGSKDRIAVMSSQLKAQIQLYLANRKNRYLFESERSDKFSPRRIQQIFVQNSKNSGIYMHPHLCRHVFATSLAQEGLSEDQRAVLCGHSKGSDAQQIYTHLSLAGIKDQAIEILDRLNL